MSDLSGTSRGFVIALAVWRRHIYDCISSGPLEVRICPGFEQGNAGVLHLNDDASA
jgi:hypothetical protein